MRRILLFAVLSSFVTLSYAQKAPAPAKDSTPIGKPKSVTIYPARLVFNLDRGGTRSEAITVSNTTASKFQLALEFQDWTRDTLGNHIYTPAGASKQSCAGWVTFDKPFLEMEPGQTTTVTVTMKVPDTEEAIAEMKWTMLVFSAVSEKKAPTKGAIFEAKVASKYGIGVHVYQTPPNVTNKEVKMLSFNELPGSKNTYRIACKNVGGTQLTGKFSIELSDTQTGAKTALEPKSIPLFPQQSRYVDFSLPANLPKGKYTAIALIDASDDDVPIEAAQREIEVK